MLWPSSIALAHELVARAPSLAGVRVLVVEDTWFVADALKDLLESFGTLVVGPAATAQARMNTPTVPISSGIQLTPIADTRDEAFLSELDASLSRAAVPELRALDELTPRAGDRSR